MGVGGTQASSCLQTERKRRLKGLMRLMRDRRGIGNSIIQSFQTIQSYQSTQKKQHKAELTIVAMKPARGI